MYYSFLDYMKWYNWYYGIAEETPVVVTEVADAEVAEVADAEVAEIKLPSPHEFPSCNFISLADLESKQEIVQPRKKSSFKNYHLRK